jgi:hypothetical protein
MADHPIDPRDVLIPLVKAALTAAEADAAVCVQINFPSPFMILGCLCLLARPDAGLIFRPEWGPGPRTRSSTSQAQGTPGLQEDTVAELLKRNQDVFDEVINHPFPRALGNGTASLDGFRYYMIVSHL